MGFSMSILLKILTFVKENNKPVKKLTIGSLKGNDTELSFELSIQPEKPLKSETKKVIEIEQHEVRYGMEVKENESILDTALKQGIALDYKCKQGTCGKCKVKVLSGHHFLQTVNHLEEKKLQHALKSNFRLACQAKGT